MNVHTHTNTQNLFPLCDLKNSKQSFNYTFFVKTLHTHLALLEKETFHTTE